MLDFFTAEHLMTHATLTGLEIILGIDNVIFIAMFSEHLPDKQRKQAQMIGLGAAFLLRIMMLFSMVWIIQLTEPLFSIFSLSLSGRDILFMIGGTFLIAKSITACIELYQGPCRTVKEEVSAKDKIWKFHHIVAQIIFVDLILSFDSVVTAIGMTNNLFIIITALVIAMAVMLLAAKPVSEFISAHPSVKIIAFAFLLFVGVMLVGTSVNIEIPKGYLYVCLFFSLLIEGLNILITRHHQQLTPKGHVNS